MQTLKPILLVEDDSVDAMTVKRAMRDLRVTNSASGLSSDPWAYVIP